MVAVLSSTVAKGGVNMLVWALGTLVLVQSLAYASATPSIDYDLGDEGAIIDRLEDFLEQHHQAPPAPHAPNAPPRPKVAHEKIPFAVGPDDPRFFLPVNQRNEPGQDVNFFQALSHKLPFPPSQLSRPRPINEEILRYDLGPEEEPDQYMGEVTEDWYPQYPYDYYQGHVRGAADLAGRLPALRHMRGEALGLQGGRANADTLMGSIGGSNEDKRQMKMVAEPEETGAEPEENKNMEEVDNRAANKAPATSQPEAVNYLNRSPSHVQQGNPTYQHHKDPAKGTLEGVYFVAIVAGCTAVAVFGVVGAGICWYRLNKSHRAAQDAEYPAYGVTGPNKDLSPSSGDRKLAQSAHMYHYQHQKQQMIALEKSSGGERHGSTSDVDSEEEGEENEYTVYECPGLAPTGEMEVKNPLFHDDPTPATPSMRKEAEEYYDDEEEEQRAK